MVTKTQLSTIARMIAKIECIKNNSNYYKMFLLDIIPEIEDIKNKYKNNELTYLIAEKFIHKYRNVIERHYQAHLKNKEREKNIVAGHCYGHYMIK